MSSDDARGLTIEQLEALVRLKQREITEEKVTRFALAESQSPAICEAAKVWKAEAPRPARSPESWRGAEGRDRYFRSLAPLPLDGHSAHRPGDWIGEQEARASAGRPFGRVRARLAPRTWRDGLLLAFELMALVGFVAVLGLSYLRLQALNREARELQRAALTRAIAPTATPWPSARQVAPVAQVEAGGVEPTLSPTALFAPVVESSAEWEGETPGTDSAPMSASADSILTPTRTATPWGHGFVQTETPAPATVVRIGEAPAAPLSTAPDGPLEPALEAALPLMIEGTPEVQEPGQPTRLVIPVLAIDAPVIEGDGEQELQQGVGHRSGSALPGQAGNVILSAHNDIYGAIFRDLHKLVAGDQVDIHAGDRVYAYRVNAVEIVMPDQVHWIAPTDDAVVTLITCYPYLIDTHRVVARAELVR